MTITQRVSNSFWAKVNKTDSCWLWIAGKTGSGYGAFYRVDNGILELAHRFALVLHGIKLDKSLQVDHLCRNRDCVNPNHLEQVPTKENLLRGVGICANNARKTHCSWGHEFTVPNTRLRPKGGRSCRKCAVRHAKEHKLRKRQLV